MEQGNISKWRYYLFLKLQWKNCKPVTIIKTNYLRLLNNILFSYDEHSAYEGEAPITLPTELHVSFLT